MTTDAAVNQLMRDLSRQIDKLEGSRLVRDQASVDTEKSRVIADYCAKIKDLLTLERAAPSAAQRLTGCSCPSSKSSVSSSKSSSSSSSSSSSKGQCTEKSKCCSQENATLSVCCEDCPGQWGSCDSSCHIGLDAMLCWICFKGDDSNHTIPIDAKCPGGSALGDFANCVLAHEKSHACDGGSTDSCPDCATEGKAWTSEVPCLQNAFNAWCNPPSGNEISCETIRGQLEMAQSAAHYFQCLCDHRIPGKNYYKKGTCAGCSEYDTSGSLGSYCKGREVWWD